MSRPVTGLVLGVVAAAIAVVVISLTAGSDDRVFWWPAVLVFGGIGGAVVGLLLGEEVAGESPDEAYVEPAFEQERPV